MRQSTRDAVIPAHHHRFVRRFAYAIANLYRTMDPSVAQVIAAPGVIQPEPPASPNTR